MPTRERPADVGTRRAATILAAIGDDLHEARLNCGLSQARVAKSACVSQTSVSRIERRVEGNASVRDIARLLAVVGLELSARAYPGGSPIRDAAQRALLDRLRQRTNPALKWRFEVPLPVPGDQRAWDAVLESVATSPASAGPPVRVAIEAETRLRDVQALQRALARKRRDDPSITAAVLLIAETRANRRIVKENAGALGADYSTPGWTILEALGSGRLPVASGLVLL
jgi:transcriptional regulator with XRE-family HTH domain